MERKNKWYDTSKEVMFMGNILHIVLGTVNQTNQQGSWQNFRAL